tara:strand:- start:24 stop:314 length:291 start_codon:yes stop_codon:yes gene_type:complete
MSYTLANGTELRVGRESHTGLLQFIAPEEGGNIHASLSGRFTSQKYLDQAWGIYKTTVAEDKRTRQPLSEAKSAFDEKPKERPVLKTKKVSKPKEE